MGTGEVQQHPALHKWMAYNAGEVDTRNVGLRIGIVKAVVEVLDAAAAAAAAAARKFH